VKLEEGQVIHRPPDFHVAHAHAIEFSLEDATRTRDWFYWRLQTLLLVDEAHLLTEKRQQSRLKTIPSRPDLTLVLITSEPDQIEASIRDRCAKIRLGPLSARELKPMVERACHLAGMPYDAQIVPALNRAGIFRPRAVLNVVDSVARGIPIEQAVVGQ
jgi:replication-associated recombination protein RarA